MSKRTTVLKNPTVKLFAIILILVVFAFVGCLIALNQMAKAYDPSDKTVVTVTIDRKSTRLNSSH